MADNDKKPNVCQFWREDHIPRCQHWDTTIPECSKFDAEGNRPPYAPWCDLIGTAYKCSFYDPGANTNTAMCVLPKTDMSVGNRLTGEKWVILPTIDPNTGEITEGGSFERISEYNDGDCDGHGTATKCTGYSPYHMQFGHLQPDDDKGTQGVDKDGKSIKIDDYRLPLSYDIYNRRAELSRCYWWQNDSIMFTVSSGGVNPIDFHCVKSPPVIEHSGFNWDDGLGMYRAPCNGAKAECPYYTGICWEYCVDELMRQGDKVLAEQVLELRYYIRKDRWDKEEYYESFIEPELQAWDGGIESLSQEYKDDKPIYTYKIPSIRTYIDDFEVFSVDHIPEVLTEGVPAEDGKKNFPDLLRRLKSLPLTPLIRNHFEQFNGENVFEVSDLYHKNLLIFGDMFWYDSDTYAINLSDPDLSFLPIELKLFDSMTKIEKKFTKKEDFDKFYNELDCLLEFMLEYMPDKITTSMQGKKENMFYINAPTVWGENIICVLNKGSGRWEFDKITFEKIFCGGVIGQTSFVITGDGEAGHLPEYARDFNAYSNKNGSITFSFFPMISKHRGNTSMVHYVYNDAVRERLPDLYNPGVDRQFHLSYKLFKINVFDNLELDSHNVKFFGNAGHALVIIPDEGGVLNNAVRLWEVESLKIKYSDGSTCDMGIYIGEDNLQRLEPNQIIIKPTNINNFKGSLCKDEVLSIGKIYIYEKRSFGEEPDLKDGGGNILSYEEIRDKFIGDDDIVRYGDYDAAQLINIGNVYEIKRFGYQSLAIGAVFKGITGRVKGHYKTKLLTWVRQPYCKDVEINYTWGANYQYVKLLPDRLLVGDLDEPIIGESVPRYYTPPCGDHDLSFFSGLGPMWYPYNDCESYARYSYNDIQAWSISIMEVFTEEGSTHGAHDIRMLGPADNFGVTCGIHATLIMCWSDWSYCNYYKKSENYFLGYSRYRGGMSFEDKMKCVRNYGELPQFGNVHRGFLRSYRSMDNVYYYYWNGQRYLILLRWVPMYEHFSNSNITEQTNDYQLSLYCSNDYYNDNSTFINPMGLMMIRGKLEGVDIEEELSLDGEGFPARYRFEDVFVARHTNEWVAYPRYKGAWDNTCWYTYRNSPFVPELYSIQWAWREQWKDLERHKIGKDEFGEHICLTDDDFRFCHQIITDNDEKYIIPIMPYLDKGATYLEGYHKFLELSYPPYKYDFDMNEHRLVCDEGEYEIVIHPPEVDEETGEYNEYWGVSINNGPVRCFDLEGNWEPSPEPDEGDCLDYRDLYTTCTQSPWVDYVQLFAPGYTDSTIAKAEEEDRVIRTKDELGEIIKAYYQRGLNASITPDNLYFLPRSLNLYDEDNYEIMFDKVYDNIPDGIVTNWESVEPGEWYPADYCFFLSYTSMQSTVNIDFKFTKRPEPGSESKPYGVKMSIGAVRCYFKFGAVEEEVEDDNQDVLSQQLDFHGEQEKKEIFKLYHIPGITFYKGTNPDDLVEVSKCDVMCLATKDSGVEDLGFIYKFDNSVEDILDGYSYFRISFRLMPNEDELDNFEDYFFDSDITNLIQLNCINLMYDKFEKGVEVINVHERKYHISYGMHGDFPPHGWDHTGSLIYYTPDDLSSVYQYDSVYGVVGMPNSDGRHTTMNKCRGRILKECIPDKTKVPGADLYQFENEQKKIHDEIAVQSGRTDFRMKSVEPPGLREILDEVGVTFPSWDCYFHNSLVRPLMEVAPYPQYSPCGHIFYADIENMWREVCGRRVFGRFIADTFNYRFKNACIPTSGIDLLDLYIVYETRVSRLMNNFLRPLIGGSRVDQLQQRLDQAIVDTESMDVPSPPMPFN